MHTFETYKKTMWALLGDESGKRYRESYLRIGLRFALELYGLYFPNCLEVTAETQLVRSGSWMIDWTPEPGQTLLEIRKLDDAKGTALPFSYILEKSNAALQLRSKKFDGGQVRLIIAVPHTIAGIHSSEPLDPVITSVPSTHLLLVSRGAAGFAMQTRATAAAEVFNRWPDEAGFQMRKARELLATFETDLMMAAGRDSLRSAAPFPTKGFEI